jgi:hypothetical protein
MVGIVVLWFLLASDTWAREGVDTELPEEEDRVQPSCFSPCVPEGEERVVPRLSPDAPRNVDGQQLISQFDLASCPPPVSDGMGNAGEWHMVMLESALSGPTHTVQRHLKQFKAELEQLGPIPKKVHTSWARKFNVLEHQAELIENGLQRLVALNPEWDVVISDDADVDRDLQKWLNATEWGVLERAHIVEKTDLWRLLLMFHEGGIYTDLDRMFNRDLGKLIGPSTKMLLPFCGLGEVDGVGLMVRDFSQDFMCSAPNNPLFKAAAALNVEAHMQVGAL